VALAPAAWAQSSQCEPDVLVSDVKPLIATGAPIASSFRARIEEGADPTESLIKLAPEHLRHRFESCRVSLEGVLESLGFHASH